MRRLRSGIRYPPIGVPRGMRLRSNRILPGLNQEQPVNQENVEAAGHEGGGQGNQENDPQAHHEEEEQGQLDHPENPHEPQHEGNIQESERREERPVPVRRRIRFVLNKKRPNQNPNEGGGNAADQESKRPNRSRAAEQEVPFPEDSEILNRLSEFLLQNNQEYPSADNYPDLIMAAHYVDYRFHADRIIERFEASRNSYLDALRNPDFEPMVQVSTELFILCMEIWGERRDNDQGTGTSDESGSSSASDQQDAEEIRLQQLQEKAKGKRPIDDPEPKKKKKKDPARAYSIRQDIRSWARRLDSLFPPSRADVSFRVPKKIWTGANGLLPPAIRKPKIPKGGPKIVPPQDASSRGLPGLSSLLDAFMDIHKHVKESARKHLEMNKGVSDWFKSLNDHPESSITVRFREDNSWDDIPMSEMAKKILNDDVSEKSSAHDKKAEEESPEMNKGVPDWFKRIKSLNDRPESSTVRFRDDNSWDDIPMSEMAKKTLNDDVGEKSSADKKPEEESHDKKQEDESQK